MPAKSKTAEKIKAPAEEVVHSIKGFDANFQCRGFAYEVGKTYEHDGDVEPCKSGFHAIGGHPLEVFRYYAPNKSRYARVTQSGAIERHSEDSKIASARITIDAEIKLPELIQAAVEWVFDRAKWKGGPVVTGANEGVTASGDYGAATASGRFGRAKGADGCALFLVERDRNWKIIAAWAGIVGRDGTKPDVFYQLKNGKPVEVER